MASGSAVAARAPRAVWLWVVRGGVAVGVLVLWQALWQTRLVPKETISNPLLVGQTLSAWAQDGILWRNLLVTISEAVLGFGIGGLVGVAIALVFLRWARLARVLNPLISTLRSVPAVILAPLFTLWLGQGIQPKVILSAILVFYVVFFNVYQGLQEVDQDLIDSVRIQGASNRQVTTHVLIPAVMFWLLGSLRLGMSFAFLGAVVGEYLGSTTGIGYLIAQGQIVNSGQQTMAGILVIAALVLVLDTLFTGMGNRLTAWRLF